MRNIKKNISEQVLRLVIGVKLFPVTLSCYQILFQKEK